MRFGLWLLCYALGMALLFPASWRLSRAMASSVTDPYKMDTVVSLSLLFNSACSIATWALGARVLLRSLGQHRTRPGWAAVAPYGKPARLAQRREQQRRAAMRVSVCCVVLVVLLIGTAMRAGGFSSLRAQLAVDLLSPAPTKGAGAWGGPRLRWVVECLQSMLVVQTPRITVFALPWLARFGRGRRGVLLRSPVVMVLGLGLAATSGCIGRTQLLSHSQAILQGYFLSQAFPALSTPYGLLSGQSAGVATDRRPDVYSQDTNSSSGLKSQDAASDIGCALLREPLVSSCGTNCFDMSWSDSCGPRDAPSLITKTVRSGAGSPMTVPARAATGPEEPPPRRVDCRIETRGRAAYGHMNGVTPKCSLLHSYPRPYWECTARFPRILHERKRHGHTPATCTLELPSEQVDVPSSHHHVTLRWSERFGLHPWKPATVLWLPAIVREQRMSRVLAMHARERLLPQSLHSRAKLWWAGDAGWAHPQLAAVMYSGDSETVGVGHIAATAGHNSRDLAAAALYDAGLLRPPASATNDDPAKATGVLLVEANAPDEPRFTFDDWKVGKATTDSTDQADLRHWTLGGASWIILDNSSEDRVKQSTEYLKAILRERQPHASSIPVPPRNGSKTDGAEHAAQKAASDADAAKQWLKHSPSESHKSHLGRGMDHFLDKDMDTKRKRNDEADGVEETGRRILDWSGGDDTGDDESVPEEVVESPNALIVQRPTIVAVHLPLFTQWCGGTDTSDSCAHVVRIGALCAEQWVPLFDELGVDLVIAHHSVGYQRGRLAGSRVTYVIAGGGLDHEAAAESKSRDEGHRNILNAPPFGKIGSSSSHGRQPHENGGHSAGRGPVMEMVWSKSKQLHCYGMLTIEPPDMYDENLHSDADQPREGNLLRPLEFPQLRWRVFDANDRTIDDVRFLR